MAAYEHKAVATCTAEDYANKRNTGKSQEWFALKRATEAALIDCFGKEPSQAREVYSLSAQDKHEARAALWGEPERKPEALPAPDVVDGEFEDLEPAPQYAEDTTTKAQPENTKTPSSEPEAQKTKADVTTFWKEFYTLRSQGNLPNAEQLKNSPEIERAKTSGNWDEALSWLHAQSGRA